MNITDLNSRLTQMMAASLVGTFAVPDCALAHALGTGGRPALALSFEPWVLISLGGATVWYGLGLRRMDSEGAGVIGTAAMVTFAGGIMVIFLALVSPIDSVGEQLFSVHMVQHLLLMMAGPPLLVCGRPAIAFFWAFAPHQRKRIGRVWARIGFARAYALFMHPLAVWSAFSGSFIFWHIPAAYQWALYSDVVHTLEHLCFFVTALAFWTLVIEPSGRRRLDYGATLIFVATTAVLSALPGALMIFAPRPLYPAHAEGVARWGLTLLQDQQLAGLLMWIPAGLIYVAATAWLFLKWLDEAERRAFKFNAPTPALLLALCACLLLAGCSGELPGAPAAPTVGGDSKRGEALIDHYGCGGCHIIPRIAGADGLVGPPLTLMGKRIFIAGLLRNSPDNMMAYLENPQAFVPGNAMPNMAIPPQDAKDITAYLYTLR